MQPVKKRRAKGNGADNHDKENKIAITTESSDLVQLSGAIGGVEVLSIDETYANAVHIRLLELKRQYESTYFEMARLLYETNVKRLYRAKSCGDHKSFDTYVEHELDFNIRKAQQLVNIWWWYGIQQGAEPKLLSGAQEIGWTKAALLVKVIDAKNCDQWFSIAKSTNRKELNKQADLALNMANKRRDTRRVSDIATPTNPPETWPQNQDVPADNAKGFVSVQDQLTTPATLPVGVEPPSIEDVEVTKSSNEKFTERRFSFSRDQNEVVAQALVWAKKIASSDSPNHVMALICQHFLTFVHDKETVIVGEWLARFERLTGLCVIAVDPKKDNDVVYGHEYVVKFSKDEVHDACQSTDSDS